MRTLASSAMKDRRKRVNNKEEKKKKKGERKRTNESQIRVTLYAVKNSQKGEERNKKSGS